MSDGWLWVVNGEGIPYCIDQIDKPELKSEVEWRPYPISLDEHIKVLNITCTSSSAFAVDSEGSIYIFLKPSVLVVRKLIEYYQNQRWYPFLGYSKTLPTDRSEFSTEDGQTIVPLLLSLPSIAWRWEENWSYKVDDCTDKEYATGFGKQGNWSKEPKTSTLVRRRMLKRYMRYIVAGQWSKMPDYGITFLAIAAGCSSAFKNGGFILYGLGSDGIIYSRIGITIESPEGVDWIVMEGINKSDSHEDIVFLSCSPYYPSMIAGTWDGRIFWRWGIDNVTPTGIIWHNIPTPHSLPVTEATLGNNSLWVTTVGGEVWMHPLQANSSRTMQDWKSVTALSYVQVQDKNSLRKRAFSLSSSGVLFCLNEKNKIEIREGITPDESAGRRFIPLIERTLESNLYWSAVCASGCSSIPKHWTNQAFHLRVENNFASADWRNSILQRLIQQSENYSHTFAEKGNEYPDNDTNDDDWELMDGWMKSSKVKIKLPSERLYKDGVIRICKDDIEIVTSRSGVRKCRHELQIVEECFDPTTICCIGLMFIGTKYYQVGFSTESERMDWLNILQNVIITSLAESPRENRFKAAWTISPGGFIRCHPMNELVIASNGNAEQRSLDKMRAVVLPGHFKQVSAGAQRIIWAINEEGKSYILDSTWSPFQASDFGHEFTDKKNIEIKEYQRNAFLRGYIAIIGVSNGLSAWMEGDMTVNGKSYRLPSNKWAWIDDDWISIHKQGCDDEGWLYSDSAPGPYSARKPGESPKYRVRYWHRTAKFACRGPWKKIDGLLLKSIHVQKQQDDRIFVWGVTIDGNLVVRQGVDGKSPEGCTWKHILCDYKIKAIAVESGHSVWAVTTENHLLHRYCSDQIDMECTDWTRPDYKNLPVISQIQALSKNLWILTEEGKLCLFYIKEGNYVSTLDLSRGSQICRDSIGSLYITSAWNTNRLKQLEINVRAKPNYKCDFEKLVTACTINISIC